jgi:hypothetical protein
MRAVYETASNTLDPRARGHLSSGWHCGKGVFRRATMVRIQHLRYLAVQTTRQRCAFPLFRYSGDSSFAQASGPLRSAVRSCERSLGEDISARGLKATEHKESRGVRRARKSLAGKSGLQTNVTAYLVWVSNALSCSDLRDALLNCSLG